MQCLGPARVCALSIDSTETHGDNIVACKEACHLCSFLGLFIYAVPSRIPAYVSACVFVCLCSSMQLLLASHPMCRLVFLCVCVCVIAFICQCLHSLQGQYNIRLWRIRSGPLKSGAEPRVPLAGDPSLGAQPRAVLAVYLVAAPRLPCDH